MDSEIAIRRSIDALESWLQERGMKFAHEPFDDDSRERLYWHYGYLQGLHDAVTALADDEPQTLH